MFQDLADQLELDMLAMSVRAGRRWSIPATKYPLRWWNVPRVIVTGDRLAFRLYFVNPGHQHRETRARFNFMRKFTSRSAAEDYEQWVRDRPRPR